MISIEEMASQRAGQDQAGYMAWLDVLSEAIELKSKADISEAQFKQLFHSCRAPEQLRLLLEALAEWRKEHPNEPNGFALLADFVDESPYGLGEWIEAVEYFYNWLGQKQRCAGLRCMLGYLHCCVEAAGSGPERLPLKDVLTDMLETYGFQG